MASISVNGLDEFLMDLREAIELPDEVAREMLVAEAMVVKDAQRRTGRAMGVHRTGVTLDSIAHGNMKRAKDGRALYVSPRGTNAKGERNAAVAFINEYGAPRRGIAPRPFIRTANEQAADAAAQAAAQVYDRWLKTRGL